MSNYPPGTGPNDPKAPWNAKEPKMTEWDPVDGKYDCQKCGEPGLTVDENSFCKKCFVPEEIEEDRGYF